MKRWALAVVICVLPSLASAEPTPADKKRAKELAGESAKAYKRGEFEVSVALIKQAYALYPEPNLLYNLGRSLESLDDKQGAVDAYTRYLAEAKQIEDRGAIERRIATLQHDLDAQKKPDPKPDPVVPPPAITAPEPSLAPTPTPAQPREDTSTGPSKLPWVPSIGGAAVIGGGGVFAYLASDREQKAKDALTGVDAQKLHDDADHFATYANVMFIGGGALVIGGVVWKLVAGGGSSRTQTGMRASVGPHSFALEWSLP